MDKIDFTIVVPVHNSRSTLKELCRRIVDTLDKTGMVFEIMFVDDYSNDDSFHILKELKLAYPEKVKIIKKFCKLFFPFFFFFFFFLLCSF